MSIDTYYGEQRGKTFLQIFTEINNTNEKVIHRSLEDQDAYDTWHLSKYFKEILDYENLNKTNISFDQLPRKEKNLMIYLIGLILGEKFSVYEIGSSLYEMIEGIKLVEKFFNISGYKTLDHKKILYRGCELSNLLKCASELLHRDYDLKLDNYTSEINGKYDVIYDQSVSNYAFTSSNEFAKFCNHADICFLNTYFSKKDTFVSTRLGKQLTYFSLDEFMKNTDKNLLHLFGLKAPGPFSGQDLSLGNEVIEGYFLLCKDNNFADKFMKTAYEIKEVKEYFIQKEISPKDPKTL